MTKNPNKPPTRSAPRQPRHVLFAAYPGVCLLDFAGPQTAFCVATHHMAARGLPGYVTRTASIAGGMVQTLEGVTIGTEPLGAALAEEVDTVIVPGTPDIVRATAAAAPLVAWLRTASGAVRRTASVCNGAFMLAAAGLLDGRRAAAHWLMCDTLQATHPAVRVERDAIFIQQDNVWTSAGVTAGIDLALALIEEDCGRDVALQVARELVVFIKRPGGQAQFSVLLEAQSRDGGVFDDLHIWIANNVGTPDLTVERLAERASMSPRNFTRVYKERTGRTPAHAVQLFRLEAARRLLEETHHRIERIATLCGFGGEERMRLAFQRNLGVAPGEYRARFSAAQ